jgi:hypothetical protein
MTAPNEIVARRLLKQAEWCQSLGSRLYSTLLRQAADDVRAGGACWTVLHDHQDDPPGSALALRSLGAIHRIVLQGQAPQLAACYPSAGGASECDDPWPPFHALVQEQAAVLRELVHHPVQTNEVGRCAALLGGFLEVAHRTGLPLRLLEVGAAAGLILRWDHYSYEVGHEGWGDPASPVRISNVFRDVYPRLDVSTRIEERRGCDTSPIDPRTDEGALTLQSYVWPDQMERFRRLTAAIDVARRVPAPVDRANAADWIEAALACRVSGVATAVYHSILWQYLSNSDQARVKRVMAAAGRAATPDSPLAWLRFEPGRKIAEVHLQLWPGGKDRLLARSGFHGNPVYWLATGS